MTSRRDLLALSVAGLMPAAALAQPRKPLKVAWFSGGTLSDQKAYLDAFREGMKTLGYVEGRDFTVEYFWRGETIKPYGWLARDVVASRPDVIMATCEVTASAAKGATRSIPIVLTASTDPVANGIVTSLARPEANVTGVSNSLIEITAKRVELMKELMPGVTRLGLLRWKYEQLGALELSATEKAARAVGITLVDFETEDGRDFERVFADARRAGIGGILDMASLAWTFPFQGLVTELQVRHRIAVAHYTRELVERGGLISYGPSIAEGFRRSAHYVDKIVRGAQPGSLPIEQPDRLELCVNLKTARAIGVQVPSSILVRADQVIG